MSTLWLIPLGVGAVGVVALAMAARKLAQELDALVQAMPPLRAVARRPARPGPDRRRAP